MHCAHAYVLHTGRTWLHCANHGFLVVPNHWSAYPRHYGSEIEDMNGTCFKISTFGDLPGITVQDEQSVNRCTLVAQPLVHHHDRHRRVTS
nr:hypothetical protein CFP56_19554 [Quercus suber]